MTHLPDPFQKANQWGTVTVGRVFVHLSQRTGTDWLGRESIALKARVSDAERLRGQLPNPIAGGYRLGENRIGFESRRVRLGSKSGRCLPPKGTGHDLGVVRIPPSFITPAARRAEATAAASCRRLGSGGDRHNRIPGIRCRLNVESAPRRHNNANVMSLGQG
jgi:hypothetical protein